MGVGKHFRKGNGMMQHTPKYDYYFQQANKKLEELVPQWRKMNGKKRALTAAYGAFALVLILVTCIVGFPHPGLPARPRLRLDFHQTETPYDVRKVALMIENRPSPYLAPLILHFTSVLPPDWRVRFMGSPESVAHINASLAIQQQVALGRMDLTYIPANVSVESGEELSRFLTSLWVYETLLAPAEWLLLFQTDTMLCANSEQDLNDWLEYDWVGAPWPELPYGGNGGLSLRRTSAIMEVLRNQERPYDAEPEDVWLCHRLGQRVGGRVANKTTELLFAGEALYSKRPMGYHLGRAGTVLYGANWGTPELRKEIYEYCPEVKMVMDMEPRQYINGSCNAAWQFNAPPPLPPP